jgi:16S rRNA (cytidine1402-2'-O)-methyltransferase
VCRELTKLHEETVRGGLGELARRANDGELTLRGEFVIVVGEGSAAGTSRGPHGAPADTAAVDAARSEVERLIAAGSSRIDAVRRVAAATGIPRRQLYGSPSDR